MRKILATPVLSNSDEDRFWSKVRRHPTGCWEWTGAKSKWGYGYFSLTHKDLRRAHRVAFEITNGLAPDKALICHSCDNRSCVRPSHLWAGTDHDNMRDKVAKGRQGKFVPEARRGEDNNKAKLTVSSVSEIRKLRSSGVFLRELSARFGVSIATIHSVSSGRTWRHLL